VIALIVSLVGLVTGLVEAVNHILATGPRGDDFTGLAAGAGDWCSRDGPCTRCGAPVAPMGAGLVDTCDARSW
jgi:hypothetical protein